MECGVAVLNCIVVARLKAKRSRVSLTSLTQSVADSSCMQSSSAPLTSEMNSRDVPNDNNDASRCYTLVCEMRTVTWTAAALRRHTADRQTGRQNVSDCVLYDVSCTTLLYAKTSGGLGPSGDTVCTVQSSNTVRNA